MEQEEKEQKLSFGDEIDLFIQHLESQADTAPLVMSLLSTRLIKESRCLEKFIEKHNITAELHEAENSQDNANNTKEQSDIPEDSDGFLEIPTEHIKSFLGLSKNIETASIAYSLMPANFIVSYVSLYDAYLGRLIKTIFNVKPEMLNESEKNLLFSDLLEFSSIDEAKDYIVEKEVESVLRDSHIKQFKWLESKLKMPLRKDLPSFKYFIEITERRNLFVHCNGIVSRQYIDICKEYGISNKQAKLGESLEVTPSYYGKCYSILFEIGVKLGQVIWRKLLPKEIEQADEHLNNVSFELLKKGHYKLALNILSFATDTLKKHYNQEILCIFTINKSLAYFLSDKKEKAKEILSEFDWSATNQLFKLAVAILTENKERALELMKEIGDNKSVITKEAYEEWPLFKELREDEAFKKLYKEIFEDEIIFVEAKPRELEEILVEHQRLKKEIEEEKKAANNLV